jgi:hypothetical protein
MKVLTVGASMVNDCFFVMFCRSQYIDSFPAPALPNEISGPTPSNILHISLPRVANTTAG